MTGDQAARARDEEFQALSALLYPILTTTNDVYPAAAALMLYLDDVRKAVDEVLVDQLRATLMVLYIDEGYRGARAATDRVLPGILKPIRAALTAHPEATPPASERGGLGGGG